MRGFDLTVEWENSVFLLLALFLLRLELSFVANELIARLEISIGNVLTRLFFIVSTTDQLLSKSMADMLFFADFGYSFIQLLQQLTTNQLVNKTNLIYKC